MFIFCYIVKGLENLLLVVLIGKGVIFDSGGIMLKCSFDMCYMIYDMVGVGCVLGVI